jgi:hypothetical protein
MELSCGFYICLFTVFTFKYRTTPVGSNSILLLIMPYEDNCGISIYQFITIPNSNSETKDV